MSHKPFRRRTSTPIHKLRRCIAAGTLAVALLAPMGCASDYDPRYMADDRSSGEGNSYRLSHVGEEIVGTVLVVGAIVAWMAFGAWAEGLNGCGCNR